MIYIDRSRISPPSVLLKEGELYHKEAASFYSLSIKERSQRTFKSKLLPWQNREVGKALEELFYGKCAFTEESIGTIEDIQVMHFRPTKNAIGISGSSVSRDHYWWLAHRWENLYPCSMIVNRSKQNRFPVKGNRAEPETVGNELWKTEEALLIDPCMDLPQEHLRFHPDGSVTGLTRKGEVTIEVFLLNDSRLMDRRAKEMWRVVGPMESVKELPARHEEFFISVYNRLTSRKIDPELNMLLLGAASDDSLPKWMKSLCRGLMDEAPFAGAARQLFIDNFQSVFRKKAKIETIPGPKADRQIKKKQKKASKEKMPKVQVAVWIDAVEIENYRAIEKLRLEFPKSKDSNKAPWIMILGKNGIGKSSILKAIALPFLSPADRVKLYPDARKCLTHPRTGKKPTDSGSIRIFLNTHPDDPVSLSFNDHSNDFVRTGPINTDLALLGYGSTRLSPRPGLRKMPKHQKCFVDNLFDHWTALNNAESWLADVNEVKSVYFNMLAIALKKLIGLDDDEMAKITRRTGELYIKYADRTLPLEDQSDGYRSVVGFATDIMLHLSKSTFSMEDVEGTVLLDEIEVHLHPEWKIQIVTRLREMFPNVQFIATTHDPLCLRGLSNGELHLLERDENLSVKADQIDVPPGLRADQILTSEWFGLPSTMDQDTIDDMQRHAELQRLKELTENQQKEKDELENHLRRRLGGYQETAVERLASGVAAELMLRKKPLELNAKQRQAMRKKILTRIENDEKTKP